MSNKRLPATVFKNIRRENILRAIEDLDEGVSHGFAESTGFDLVFQGKHYPPKAVFGIAGRHALGRELLPEHFSGGEDSICFKILRDEGFDVIPKRRAFLLTWNPDQFPVQAFLEELRQWEVEKRPLRWSVGHRKDLPIGSELFLMRLGMEPKGIVGRAISTSEVFEAPHWDLAKAAAGLRANYVTCVPIGLESEPFIPLALLQAKWPAFDWTPQSSGVEIHDSALVSYLMDEVGLASPDRMAEEVAPEEVHIEGALVQITINAYERDPAAKKKCLKHHGHRCAACGRTMAEMYGALGEGIIHVHHRKPLHTIGKAYQVDPVNDLIPVCPNCHAILHSVNPAMSVEALSKVLNQM